MEQQTVFYDGHGVGASIAVPSSKSYLHRQVLAAALAQGQSNISNVSWSNDIHATLGSMCALGAQAQRGEREMTVHGAKEKVARATLDCGESASTLRFLIPVSLVMCENPTLTGTKTLLSRPLEPYFRLFEENGISYTKTDTALILKGTWRERVFRVAGGVSSQFVTGLLYTLPLLPQGGEIVIEGNLESKPYIDITLDVLAQAGIQVQNDNYERFSVAGGRRFLTRDYIAPGDYSQAAFFLAAGCAVGGMQLTNLDEKSLQGDRVIVDILRRMNAQIVRQGDTLTVQKSALCSAGRIDVRDCPDIVPILALCCAAAEDDTVLEGIARLRMKECDRVAATVNLLHAIGGEAQADENTMTIRGGRRLVGGTVDSCNDHRIAMTAAVATLWCENPVTICTPMSVRKSYPHFYDDFAKIGGVSYGSSVGQ